FQLRGRSKEDIIAALRERRADLAGDLPPDSPEAASTATTTAETGQGSSLRVEDFWSYDDPLDPSLVVITPPPTQETVLDLLGPIPLLSQTGNSSLAQTAALEQVRAYFQEVYQKVSQEAIAQAMASPETDDSNQRLPD
ncbi:MAG: hypothetical protein EA395_04795, partial [Phormidium sp. GEM2.Bin31]